MAINRRLVPARADEDFGGERGLSFQRGLAPAAQAAPIGPVALGPPGNLYTFTLVDGGNLISSGIEAQITANAHYVISLISHYLTWQGTIDFVVDIRPDSQTPYPQADGILPSVAQVTWNGSAWINETLEECKTGIDTDTARFDAGCTIYLAEDGSIRNYGAPVWFDPNPQFGVNPGVPAGTHDFIGIYTHEIVHALGFYQVTQQWQQRLDVQGGMSYFTGANAVALYGGGVPFVTGYDHYGNTSMPSIPITRGLMFQFGNYEGNRLDIGRIDLAILADLGHAVRTYDGLSLFEMIDTQLSLAGSNGADILYGDYHANAITGLAGSDVIDGGGGADQMNGGADSDFYYVDNAGDVIVEADGGGYDNVLAALNYTLTAGAWVEILSTTDHGGTANINLTGNALNNILIGNAGRNILDGGGGADRLAGFGGDDFLIVDSMDDFVDEGAGGGYDNLLCRVDYVLTTAAEIEVISTDNHAGTAGIDITGSAFGQVIIGNAGSNVLIGGGGADRLAGLGGNDFLYVDSLDDFVDEAIGGGYDNLMCATSYTLFGDAEIEVMSTTNHAGTAAINLTGSAYNQVIIGNAGNNILDGSFGADRLAGFGGIDSYKFSTNLGIFNVDTIDGFDADDFILLDNAIFTGLADGALPAGAFVTGSAAADADDRIIYNSATGALYFDADGNGAGAQIQFATLLGAPALTASDFTVI